MFRSKVLSCTECNIPTYVRGTKRIDFILTSINILPFVSRMGYTAFYEVNESDHRGMFIDLSNKLLDNRVELRRPKKRLIGSNCKGELIYKYKERIHNLFNIHKIYEKAQRVYEQSKSGVHSIELENTD